MIQLKDIALDFAQSIQELAVHPEILATTNMPEPYPADGAKTFIEETLDLRAKGHRYVFAIFKDDTLVGTVGLHNVHQGAAELGYWIGKPFWGKGYASQATRAAVGFAFSELKLNLLNSHCLLTNRASFHILEKAGFHLTGVKTMADTKWPDRPFAFFEQSRQMWEIGSGT